MLVQVLNQLLEYSRSYIIVKYDFNLQIPGFSYFDVEINDRFVPTIAINPNCYPQEVEVIAHILSHEWGHHVLNHLELPNNETNNEKKQDIEVINKIEDEADRYAAGFIKKYSYNTDNIINYIKKHSNNSKIAEHRIDILLEKQ